MKSGLLFINLGTPDSTELLSVKRYLREFLTDKRVIDIPWPMRYLLVYGLIVPFRAKKSAHAYKAVWTKHGSPLLLHSLELVEQVQIKLANSHKVTLGMSYGSPSIQSALEELKECETITILPLYPQYSSAATGSAIEATLKLIETMEVIPSLKVIRDFYKHPAYIAAQAKMIDMHLDAKHHLLFSYHGIPERQIYKSGCKTLCTAPCPSNKNPGCYKSQCYQTTHLIAQALNLSPQQYSTSFQSRLGKTPWIKPYTDELLIALAEQGIKNLTITCPSFVTDCLETLEEIGIRAKEQWTQLGGEQCILIPSMNSNELWIQAIAQMIEAF
jgi:ferrochelatase